ncbi:MAG: Omp28-related outer membrane protein [Bacteroidales bacterium]|nr:Omp28-related outer membrane protein [Bacteroidales bacterium]
MKNSLLIFFAYIFSLSISAQENISPPISVSDDIRIQKNEARGTDDISGEVISTKPYVNGTTMDLEFTFSLEANPWSQVDYLELTFPEGITPLGGSANIYYGYLNPIQGQSISWGADENNPALATIYPGVYEFYVSVQISSVVSGDQNIDCVFSDNLGSPDIYTITLLSECPPVPDLIGLSGLAYLDYYMQVPKSQASFVPAGLTKNAGSTLTGNTEIQLEVDDFYSETQAIDVPLAFWEKDPADFPVFTAPATGEYNFTFTANASNDWNPSNASNSYTLNVAETKMSYHNNIVKTKTNVSNSEAIKGMLFKVMNTDTITAVEFYITKAFAGNMMKAKIFNFDGTTVTDLIAQTAEVETLQDSTWLVANFAEMIILQPGDYLIGICEGSEDEMYLGVATNLPPYGVNWNYFNGVWYNMSTYIGQTANLMINAVFGTYLVPLLDAALQEVSVPEYALQGSFPLSGVIKNNSNVVLQSIDVSYSIDNATPVVETFYPGIASLNEFEFEFSVPPSISTIGNHQVKIYISNPNGLPDEITENDTIQKSIYIMGDAPLRRVLCEEATGTWCGWCVAGHVLMDYMAETYPDQWIGIAVHNGDPMEVPEYSDGMNPYIQGYPNGTMNRDVKYIGPLEFEEEFLSIKDQLAPVEVFVEDAMINTEDGTLTFTLVATFYADLSGVKFNAIIVEDEVTGTGSGWDQTNYYSGGGYGEMGGYELLPNPVPAEDMVYEHVARAIPGGFYGVDESLPDQVLAGQNYSWEFSVALEDDWELEFLKVIGVVADKDTEFILNSVQSEEISIAAPQMNLNASEIVFDTTLISYSSQKNIEISNTGELTLEISSISSSNSVFTPEFSSLTLAPGESEVLSITFAPTSQQLFTGNLTISSNDPLNGIVTIPLSGYGISGIQQVILDFDGITNLQTKTWTEDGYDWEIYSSGTWFATSGSCSAPNGLIMNGGRLKLADGSAFNLVSADIHTWSGIFNATVRGYKEGVMIYEVIHYGLTAECEFYEYGFYDIDELEGYIGQTGIAVDNLLITFDVQSNCDASLTEISGSNKYVSGGNNVVGCLIKNLGIDPITSIDLSWSIDENASIYTESFSGLNIQSNQEYALNHADIIQAEPGQYDLNLWISDVNGTNCDENPANDSTSRQIFVVYESVQPHVLIEEFTTSLCGYCPGGHLMMDTLLANYEKFIGVAHHAGFYTDAMTIPAHEIYANIWASGAPTGTLNRISGDIGVGDWEMLGNEILSDLALGEINFDGSYFSPETRELNAVLNTSFLLPMEGDFRFTVFIVEDSLHGIGTGWDQANYFNNTPGHPFYGLGNPIVGYRHNHVVRQVLPGNEEPECWGNVGAIPASVEYGETYSETFNFVIPDDYILENVHLVGFVSNYQSEVINVAKVEGLDILTKIQDNTISKGFTIFPNPSNGYFSVDCSNLKLVSVIDLHGQYLRQFSENQIDISDLTSGVYIFQIETDEGKISRQLVIKQ